MQQTVRRKQAMDNKVPQHINDIVEDNVKKLAQLFPSAVKDGEVDFEALKEELGQFEEVGSEKYELTWAGKKNAKKIAQEDVIGRTLKFIPEDSKNADTTENLYIEGDNLEVLKLLRQNYYGVIKMIYIDPPYNTGNDFVYNDMFKVSANESNYEEGFIDENKSPLQRNIESSNRFHAKWVSMMYSRLILARDFLREDGVVFISIDENEVSNLKKICDEIFGEKNFVSQLTIVVKPEGRRYGFFAKQHEYLLVYSKNYDELQMNEIPAEGKSFQYFDERGGFNLIGLRNRNVQAFNSSNRPNLRYPFYVNTSCVDENGFFEVSIEQIDGYEEVFASTIDGLESVWRWGKEKAKNEIFDLVAYRGNDSQIRIFQKNRSSTQIPKTVWDSKDYISNKGTKEVQRLIGKGVFDFPKPVELIKKIIEIGTDEGDIVLDFFAGSATTGQACLELQNEKKGKRKFILIQYPEVVEQSENTKKLNINTIYDIGVRRLKAYIQELNESQYGFKSFKVENTNIKWNSLMDMGQVDMNQLEYTPDLIDFMPGANDVDIVYELMLRQRDVALSETLEQLSNIGNRTYLYASSYLVCLETTISEELVSELAELDPLPIKFIFRDSAFKDDIALKDETFRRLKALIEKNAGTSKPTYTVEFI